jgi:heterotetrameric sarcosine oxidase delta subunit
MSAARAPSPTCTEPLTTMLRIACPWCGARDETEFRYRGDASRPRPRADAGLAEFTAWVYERPNPRGWHVEWWLHVGGCRRLLKVMRHTLSDEIAWVGVPTELPPSPPRSAP